MRPGRFIGIVSFALIGACTSATSATTSTSPAPPISTTFATTTTQAPTTTTTLPIETGVWRPIPEGPLSPRMAALSFWTGEELLIVGGVDNNACLPTREDAAGGGSGVESAVFCTPIPSVLADGAAFDPDAGTWRTIAPAPVRLARSAGGVVHESTVYVLVPGDPETFLAYHIEEDRWERLPPPQTRNGSLVESGDRLALVKYSDAEGDPDAWLDDPNREVAPDLFYDPATREWQEIPTDPLVPSWDRSMAWTGRELVLLGVDLVHQPCADDTEEPSYFRVAAFDPEIGVWRRLAESPLIVHGGGGPWYFDDGRLINPSLGRSGCGIIDPDPPDLPYGGLLDLESGEWSPLPNPPPEPVSTGAFTGYTATGRGLLLERHGWLFDPARDRWESLPAPPDDPSIPLGRIGSAVLFAGPDLIVWGGFLYGDDGLGEMVSAGWMWRPEP